MRCRPGADYAVYVGGRVVVFHDNARDGVELFDADTGERVAHFNGVCSTRRGVREGVVMFNENVAQDRWVVFVDADGYCRAFDCAMFYLTFFLNYPRVCDGDTICITISGSFVAHRWRGVRDVRIAQLVDPHGTTSTATKPNVVLPRNCLDFALCERGQSYLLLVKGEVRVQLCDRVTQTVKRTFAMPYGFGDRMTRLVSFTDRDVFLACAPGPRLREEVVPVRISDGQCSTSCSFQGDPCNPCYIKGRLFGFADDHIVCAYDAAATEGAASEKELVGRLSGGCLVDHSGVVVMQFGGKVFVWRSGDKGKRELLVPASDRPEGLAVRTVWDVRFGIIVCLDTEGVCRVLRLDGGPVKARRPAPARQLVEAGLRPSDPRNLLWVELIFPHCDGLWALLALRRVCRAFRAQLDAATQLWREASVLLPRMRHDERVCGWRGVEQAMQREAVTRANCANARFVLGPVIRTHDPLARVVAVGGHIVVFSEGRATVHDATTGAEKANIPGVLPPENLAVSVTWLILCGEVDETKPSGASCEVAAGLTD